MEKLGIISIRELSRTAKDRHAGSLGYSEAMLIFYNKKNTGGLQMEKLYAKNKKPAPLDDDTNTANQEVVNHSQMSLFSGTSNETAEL